MSVEHTMKKEKNEDKEEQQQVIYINNKFNDIENKKHITQIF